jgi:PAS domain S-box-containing protein
MSAPRRALPLRVLLSLFAATTFLYVAIVAVQLVRTVLPLANDLRGRSRDLLDDHDRVSASLVALQDARRQLSRLAPPIVPSAEALPDRDVLRDSLLAVLDRSAVTRASIDRADVPLEMRLLLADAVGVEAAIAVTLLEAERAIAVNQPQAAVAAFRTSGVLSDSAAGLLSRAQRVAIAQTLDQQENLASELIALERFSLAFSVLGLVLIAIGISIARSRIYLPVRAMERAVRRIASGDLAADVRVTHDDELGRLGEHLNEMTAVLRERAADETRKRENLTERFGRILDSSAGAICVFDATTLQVVLANRGARETFGYSTEELLRRRLPELLSGLSSERLDTLLSELQAPDSPRVLLTTWLARADGRLRAAEVALQATRDAETGVIVLVAEDAAARERLRDFDARLREFALEHQTSISRGALDATLRPLTALTCETLDADRCGVWRVSSEAAEPVAVFDAVTGAHRSDLPLDGVETGPETYRCAIRVGGRDTAMLVVRRDSRAFSADERAFIGAAADLAARVFETAARSTLEQALARAHRMDSIGQLAGGVAHDFNNLLTAILGNLEASRAGLEKGSELDVALGEAEHAALRAADLTRQLLTFARQQVVETRAVRVESRLGDAEPMLRRLVGPERILRVVMEPLVGSVRLGSGQLEQILVNLVVNARDATPPGGEIIVEARRRSLGEAELVQFPGLQAGEHIELCVLDTGVGMEQSTLERVFEPFFTTKGVGAGTGLGLAVCYGIVRNAGGVIQATSAPGVGTTFRILLPSVPERDSPRRGSAASGESRGVTVLVAEDEPAIRALVSRMLAARGYRVLTGADGEEALGIAAAEPGPIELLVTDVVMPRLGGVELARALRAQRPEVRILFMSGYTATAPIQDGEFADAAFLAKPFNTQELLQRVQELLRGDAESASAAPR